MAVIQDELTPRVLRVQALPATRKSIRRLGIWLAVAGWASLALMWVTESADRFGHDQGTLPMVPAMGLFLVGWIVMVAAMMLPSSGITLERVDRTIGPEARGAGPLFMLGYFSLWGVFGAAAFAGDGILHLVVERMSWLAQSPSFIIGSAAMFAGAAEMIGRTPPAIVPSIRGDGGAFSLGKAHAVDRIRRCWPLMLFAMAVGMSSPRWMVGLTLVMTLELRPSASVALRSIGLLLFAIGVAVVVEPGWTTVLLGST